MIASLHEIGVEELAEARLFFENSPQSQLVLIEAKFYEEQPFFSATGYALQRMHIAQYAVKVLLQSIFEVYYVATIMNGRKIKPIDISDIQAGINLLAELSESYNSNHFAAESSKYDLTTIFFRNSAVFEHSIDTMNRAFGDIETILDYRESLAIYNALLRAIEIAD
jgi:hypothetical protein